MELFPTDEDNCPCQTFEWCHDLFCVAGSRICLTILFVSAVVLSALFLICLVGVVVAYCVNSRICQTICGCCVRPKNDNRQSHNRSNEGTLVEVRVDPSEASEHRTEPYPIVVTVDWHFNMESASRKKKLKFESVSSKEVQEEEANESANEESGDETAAYDPTVDDQASLIHHK